MVNYDTFYQWLSNQWEMYLDSLADSSNKASVDFSKTYLREIVAGLFMEGLLEPCPQPKYESFPEILTANPWLQVGLVMEKSPPVEEKCREHLEEINNMLAASSVDWFKLAALWGGCSYLKDLEGIVLPDYDQIDGNISKKFEIYINNHYEELFYLSYRDQPATVDKVMHFLGTLSGDRKALLCLDGMGFQEWFCIRDQLASKGLEKFREGAIFALLPTITSVSRRALFCGQKEMAKLLPEKKGFVEHIETYWRESKSARKDVFLNAPPEWNPEYSHYDYLGLILNIVDQTAHMPYLNEKGKRLMQFNLKMRLEESNLDQLIINLLRLGFRVFLTADHGTVYSRETVIEWINTW